VAGSLADRLDALLPQTQCTRCGYAGCRPYAEALACGSAGIDQCPPGGVATAAALAALLGVPARPVSAAFGREAPARVAVIDETVCIGCAKCLPACPVDAIVGARKQLHTVIARECSGCELCLPPCPVDCIEMRPQPEPAANQAALNRLRFEAHAARLLNRAAERQRELDLKKAAAAHRAAEP